MNAGWKARHCLQSSPLKTAPTRMICGSCDFSGAGIYAPKAAIDVYDLKGLPCLWRIGIIVMAV